MRVLKPTGYLLGAAALLSLAAPQARAQSFYEGKDVSIIINLGMGGATGILAQLFAKHWKENTAGKPNFVVKSMSGGGQMQGINFVLSKAKPDGLTIGWLATSAVVRAVGPKSQQVDWNKFLDTAIAGVGSQTVMFVRKDIKPGLTTATDITKATDVVFGSTRASSRLSVAGRLALDLLGVPYKYVQGYRGGRGVQAAFMSNELNSSVRPSSAYLASVKKNIIDPGVGIPLWYYGAETEDGKIIKEPALSPIKSFREVYEEIKGESPKGLKWEAIKLIANVAKSMSWLVAAAPGSPAERVAILREGFMKTVQSKAYRDDVIKRAKEMPTFLDEKGVANIIKTQLKADPKIFKEIKDTIDAK